jgi:hypothetical protein
MMAGVMQQMAQAADAETQQTGEELVVSGAHYSFASMLSSQQQQLALSA